MFGVMPFVVRWTSGAMYNLIIVQMIILLSLLNSHVLVSAIFKME